MTRIIQDLEHGAVVLIHDLTGQPTPGETVPEEAVGAMKALAGRLGIAEDDIGPFAIGYLFDVANHVIEAISGPAGGTGHAQAGTLSADTHALPETEAVAPQAPSVQAQTEAVSTVGGEHAVGAPEVPPAVQAQAVAPVVPAELAGPSVDDIIAKAQQQWGGGGTPAA